MGKNRELIGWIGLAVLGFAMFDVIVVMFTMLQVSSGAETQHIWFWDEQVRIITGLTWQK